jgi:hypothetical protein
MILKICTKATMKVMATQMLKKRGFTGKVAPKTAGSR